MIDLPPPPAVEVTEHVVFKGYCPRCAAWKGAAEPCAPGEVVGQRRFGARLMALIGYLSEELRLPYEAIKSYLKTIHGRSRVRTLPILRRGLAQTLQPVADDLQAQMRGSAIVSADRDGVA